MPAPDHQPARRRRLIRSPRYIPTALTGLAVIAVGSAVIAVMGQQIRSLQLSLGGQLRSSTVVALLLIPNGLFVVLTFVLPLIAIVALLVERRRREAFTLLFAWLLGASLDLLVAVALQRASLVDALGALRGAESRTPLPTQFTMTGLIAVLIVAHPWGSRRILRVGWWAVTLSTITRFLLTDLAASPVILMIGVGVFAGGVVGMLVGELRTPLPITSVVRAASRVGLTLVRVLPTVIPRSAGSAWLADDTDGQRWMIVTSGPDQGTAVVLRQLSRLTVLKSTGERRPIRSLRRLVEHRALTLLVAERSGARVPHAAGITSSGDEILLIVAHIDGDRLSDLADPKQVEDCLRGAWEQVRLLHNGGVYHGDLTIENLIVDPDGEVWIVDFERGEIDAEPATFASDIANLLVSSSGVVGPEAAVEAAVDVLGRTVVATALPHLQPAGLRRSARRQRVALGELRNVASERVGVADVELAKLRRLGPRTLITFAMLAGAVYLLLPQLTTANDILGEIRNAQPWWVAAAVLASVLTYLGATLTLVGSVPDPVPFGSAFGTSVATSFTNAVAPAGVGGMALGVRYLQRLGVPTPVALTGVGVKTVLGLFVHITLMAATVLALGRSEVLSGVSVPWGLLGWIGLGVVIAVLLLITLPVTRRWAGVRLVPRAREAFSGMGEVMRSPRRLVALVGGATMITVSYALCLVFSAQAVGVSAPISEIVIVSLTASIVASVAPTPGGLGAAEAAYAAGLAAIGLSASSSLAVVLIFRGVTFWLPILPGYLAMRALERRRLL